MPPRPAAGASSFVHLREGRSIVALDISRTLYLQGVVGAQEDAPNARLQSLQLHAAVRRRASGRHQPHAAALYC